MNISVPENIDVYIFIIIFNSKIREFGDRISECIGLVSTMIEVLKVLYYYYYY